MPSTSKYLPSTGAASFTCSTVVPLMMASSSNSSAQPSWPTLNTMDSIPRFFAASCVLNLVRILGLRNNMPMGLSLPRVRSFSGLVLYSRSEYNGLHTEIFRGQLCTQPCTHTWIEEQHAHGLVFAKGTIFQRARFVFQRLVNQLVKIGYIANGEEVLHEATVRFNSTVIASISADASSCFNASEGSRRIVFGLASPVKI